MARNGKRLLALLLALTLCVALLPGALAEDGEEEPGTIALVEEPEEPEEEQGTIEAAPEESPEDELLGTGSGVKTKLEAVLAQYPDGSYWTGSFDGAVQCYGFAGLVVYNVFGKSTASGNPCRWWTYAGASTSGMVLIDQVTTTTESNVQSLLAKARPGDVLQFDAGANGHQHSMILYDLVYSGTTVTGAKIYECNWYGSGLVSLRSLTNQAIAQRQKCGDGTMRGKLSLLRSDNWEAVNGGTYSGGGDTGLPTISGEVYPSGTLTQGRSFDLRGVISSQSKLTDVSGYITSATGQNDLHYSTNPNSFSYNIQTGGLDEAFAFGKLPKGSYVYVVTATNAVGTATLIRSSFVIGSPTTYTVNYNANGGTGAPAAQTKIHGTALTLSTTRPSRASVSAGSYTVTLDPNGGSVRTASLTAARTTAYSFRGWNTKADGSGTGYAPGATYKTNASVTLYAQWDSSTSTAAVTLPTPSRSGFVFRGWATSASATGGITGSYKPVGNVTLIAIWGRKEAPAFPFVDVKTGKYYFDAVVWAYYHDPQIASGTDATHFSPNQTCTRAQALSFLWNALGKPEPKGTANPFVDVTADKFYYKAVLWAWQNGITSGTDASHFGPNQTCTRAQVATFIWSALGKPAPKNTACPFTDVTAGKFYYKAVLWAWQNGIANGMDASHFCPNDRCTRGQIVTFLYAARDFLGA